MNSTNNNSYKNAALKVFAQLGQLIDDDENIKQMKSMINQLNLIN